MRSCKRGLLFVTAALALTATIALPQGASSESEAVLPYQQLSEKVLLPEARHEVLDRSRLVGVWENVDPNTSGIVKIEIYERGLELSVRAWGSCSPDPCDWGTVDGLAYSTSVMGTVAVGFTAHYRLSWKSTIVAGSLTREDGGNLFVSFWSEFLIDPRSSYASWYQFRRLSSLEPL
jgi:hypothetical protein